VATREPLRRELRGEDDYNKTSIIQKRKNLNEYREQDNMGYFTGKFGSSQRKCVSESDNRMLHAYH